MSKDPAFLFYSSDFLIGTAFFTREEVGDYIRILCHMHQVGGYMTLQEIKVVAPEVSGKVLVKFKDCGNDLYSNERLLKEMLKRKTFTESRVRNLKKAHKGKHMDSHMENENRNENKDKNKKENEKNKFGEDGLVLLTQEEYGKLLVKLGESKTAEFIRRLENYIGSKGKKYKSHYHTILSWATNEKDSETQTIRGQKDLEKTVEKFRKELHS